MAPVTFDAVRKEYEDGVAAVHGVDLAVADGEFVVLVGPSGCGKSTTLRMVAGLESITAGMLRIGDRVVNDVPPAERDVAMVFQSYALYPHMTVRENLGFALRLRKRPKAEIAARVQAVAETLGLADLLDRMPRQLSGGQRQRVAIGRAIVREPRVFLFDEPLSNLDAKLRAEMRREIAALHRRLGATMLYVTHDQVEAMTLGDRVVVMSAGHVRQVDTPAALYARPRDTFVAGFLGSPPMNLLPGRLTRTDDRVSVELDGTGVRLALPAALARGALAGDSGRAGPDGRVVVGVRPEHLRVGSAAEPPDGDVVLPAAVELVEPLGHEQLVHLRHGRSAVVARTAPEVRPPDGGAVTLRAAGERLHLFDAATGVAIDPA